jgi:SAM-dependent methyltransferase
MNVLHEISPPSPWVVRWSGVVKPGASVLDVACGSGRHLKWFLDRGCVVTGVNRDIASASQNAPGANLIEADIEQGPWPLTSDGKARQFDAVIVTNYLWRALMPTLLASLAPGGALIYETFTAGNETVGRPARPDFLLREGELLDLCAGLHIVGYENGFLAAPDRFVQRIAAVKQPSRVATPGSPVRYPL